MRSLSRGIGAGLLSGTWLAILSLALAPIYVNLLGIESYGLIGLYTAALAIGSILDVALSSTVSREISWMQSRPAEQSKMGTLLRSVEIVYWLAVSGIVVILLAAVAAFGSSWVSASALPAVQITGALALMLISLAIQLPSGLYTASLIGLHRQARSAGLLAGFGTLRGFGAALLAWGVSDDIRVFFLWHVAVGLVQIFWLRRQVWSYMPPGDRSCFSVASLVSIRNAAGAMFLITAMGMMLSQMDKVVLAFLVPLESLGHYTLAWGLAGGLSIIATPVAQGFGTRYSILASNNNDAELATNIVLASQLMFVLMIPPAVITSFFSEEIVFLWTRNASVAGEVSIPLNFLLYGTALVGCVYPFLYALHAKKAYKQILKILFVCLIVLFPLVVFAVNIYGVVGAALCWLIYAATLLVTYPILARRIVGNHIQTDRLFWKFVFLVTCSFVVGWVSTRVIELAIGSLLLIPILGLVILGVSFSALAVCPELRIKLANYR